MALSAFVTMLIVVFVLSAILSPWLGNGANPPPRGDDASTGNFTTMGQSEHIGIL
jgi:hypothetical protein